VHRSCRGKTRVTVAKFLDKCAAIFEQPALNNPCIARQCRDCATIASQIRHDGAVRRDAAPEWRREQGSPRRRKSAKNGRRTR
jgi:hypothetical protein